jgi:streptomycin 6-kinase
MFDDHLTHWGLVPDGEPIATHSSRLLPVQRNGAPAILEISLCSEERCAGLLMLWWNGDGAARVLAHDGTAFLLERATGGASLSAMARDGRDDEASRIICAVAARLHAPPRRPPPELIALSRWLEELGPAASRHGGCSRTLQGPPVRFSPRRRTLPSLMATCTTTTSSISGISDHGDGSRSIPSASSASGPSTSQTSFAVRSTATR